MRLLILCAVLSVILAVSLASPVKTQIRDVSDDTSSSEENDQVKVNNIVKDNNEEDNSSGSSEEKPKKSNIVKDDPQEDSSSEEVEDKPKKHHVIVVVDDNEILDIKKVASRTKRSFPIDSTANSHNHLKVKDEGSIKYEKYLKLQRLKRALEGDIVARFGRSVDTSEENSSEEEKKSKKPNANEQHNEAGHENAAAGAVEEKPAAAPSEKPNEAPAEEVAATHAEGEVKPEEEHVKTDAARRRRSTDVSSEENQSVQEKDVNEVFIFSSENQQDSEENFKSDQLKNNEYVVMKVNDLENVEKSVETKTSDEDYAQGCGGSNGNQDEDSNENSNEDNETTR